MLSWEDLHGDRLPGILGGGKLVKYLEFVGLGLGFNVVRGACIPGVDPVAETTGGRRPGLAKLSRRFHERLSKPAYPAPSLMQLMMFRSARTSAKLLAGDENRDHTHYRDQGWFDSDYFYPTKLGPLKKAVGAAFDRMAARKVRQREG